MALKSNRLAAATAVAAAFSLLAVPAAAIELPRPAAVDVYDGDAGNVERDRRRRWRHRDNGIDAGDVVAGVLVIGAIAAIAGAAKNGRERDRYEERLPEPGEGYGYRTPGEYERADSRGIDNAVDICVGEVERGAERVGTVDSATRLAEGWRVSGELENGAAWSCAIGNDGRISDLNLGDYAYGAAPAEAAEDNQWSDEVYARARENQLSAGAGAEDRIDGDLADVRYRTAQASNP